MKNSQTIINNNSAPSNQTNVPDWLEIAKLKSQTNEKLIIKKLNEEPSKPNWVGMRKQLKSVGKSDDNISLTRNSFGTYSTQDNPKKEIPANSKKMNRPGTIRPSRNKNLSDNGEKQEQKKTVNLSAAVRPGTMRPTRVLLERNSTNSPVTINLREVEKKVESNESESSSSPSHIKKIEKIVRSNFNSSNNKIALTPIVHNRNAQNVSLKPINNLQEDSPPNDIKKEISQVPPNNSPPTPQKVIKKVVKKKVMKKKCKKCAFLNAMNAKVCQQCGDAMNSPTGNILKGEDLESLNKIKNVIKSKHQIMKKEELREINRISPQKILTSTTTKKPALLLRTDSEKQLNASLKQKISFQTKLIFEEESKRYPIFFYFNVPF